MATQKKAWGAYPLGGIVRLEESSDIRAQIWTITPVEERYYTISCQTLSCGERYLEGVPPKGKVKLTRWRPSGHEKEKRQRWLLEKVDKSLFSKGINKILDHACSLAETPEDSYEKSVMQCLTGSFMYALEKQGYLVEGYYIMCYDESKYLQCFSDFHKTYLRLNPLHANQHQKWDLIPVGAS